MSETLRGHARAGRLVSRYATACMDRLIVPISPRSRRLYLQWLKFGLLGWEPEARRLQGYAPAGNTAVDAGANIGLWTYALASSGLFDRVIAFEPNASLTQDLRSARLRNVTVIHKALSNVPGSGRLRVPRNDGMLLTGWASLEDRIDLETADYEEIPVERTRLDDEVDAAVSFIKIDVEGHELAVLEGAKRILVANRPMCLIECREHTRAQVIRWFHSLEVGYERLNTEVRYGLTLSPGNELFSRV